MHVAQLLAAAAVVSSARRSAIEASRYLCKALMYSQMALQMLWKRPREPSARLDATAFNHHLLHGLPQLTATIAEGPSQAGALKPDVWVTTSDGARLPTFRLLLAASSPAFKAMFDHPLKESAAGELTLNAPAQHVRWFLDYVHGSLHRIEPCMAGPLFQLADGYGMKQLEEACRARLVHNLCAESVPLLLQLSDMHNCQSLADAAVAYVRSDGCAVQSYLDAFHVLPAAFYPKRNRRICALLRML